MSKALLYSPGSAQRMPQRVWRYPPPKDNDTTTTFSKPATISRPSARRSIEVWATPCIVTCFGQESLAQCSILLNPANPQLSGVSQFPYFPRGGPVPSSDIKTMHKDWQPLGHVSSWGGMEVGSGMMYAVSVIDGLVHQLGGMEIARRLSVVSTPSASATIQWILLGRATGPRHDYYDHSDSIVVVIVTTPHGRGVSHWTRGGNHAGL